MITVSLIFHEAKQTHTFNFHKSLNEDILDLWAYHEYFLLLY